MNKRHAPERLDHRLNRLFKQMVSGGAKHSVQRNSLSRQAWGESILNALNMLVDIESIRLKSNDHITYFSKNGQSDAVIEDIIRTSVHIRSVSEWNNLIFTPEDQALFYNVLVFSKHQVSFYQWCLGIEDALEYYELFAIAFDHSIIMNFNALIKQSTRDASKSKRILERLVDVPLSSNTVIPTTPNKTTSGGKTVEDNTLTELDGMDDVTFKARMKNKLNAQLYLRDIVDRYRKLGAELKGHAT